MTKKFLLCVGAFALFASVLVLDVKHEGAETEPRPWTMPSNYSAEVQPPSPLTAPLKV